MQKAALGALKAATWVDDDQAVARAIQAGAPVEEPVFDGWTPLMVASMGGKLRSMRELLSGGANPNGRGEGGAASLATAAWAGERESPGIRPQASLRQFNGRRGHRWFHDGGHGVLV